MKFIQKLNSIVAKFEGWLLVLVLTSMVLLSFTQVCLRNFAGTGIDWADIFLRQMVLWVGLIGASLSVKSDKNIAIDAASRFLPFKYKMLSKVITNFFSVYIAYLLSQAAYTFILDEKEFGSVLFQEISLGFVNFEEVHTWVFASILPVAFVIISARFLINGIEAGITFFTQEEELEVTE
ncbi:MAG: hypothetical protein DWQ06_10310 [Calditrichaeota bacterium]|nr:MAG: hypothetical protein DWQ06_10310 [Calditrichota bacterium]